MAAVDAISLYFLRDCSLHQSRRTSIGATVEMRKFVLPKTSRFSQPPPVGMWPDQGHASRVLFHTQTSLISLQKASSRRVFGSAPGLPTSLADVMQKTT